MVNDIEQPNESRSERFVDTKEDQLLMSGNINDLHSFYQGDLVQERMVAVRKSIYYVRENWAKFEQMMAKLKDFMSGQAVPESDLCDEVKKIFERRRNWEDIETNEGSFSSLAEEFNVIFTYTTQLGFKEVFKVCDRIFRRESSVNYLDIIQNAVFLVELFNIDLYNFVYKYPKYSNFEGVVYRGMAVLPEVFGIFESLMKQPINKRYISIPLGLWSSSMDIQVATGFVKDQLKNPENSKNVPLIMKIHVINLSPEHLEFYRKKYRQSKVSSICAVYIGDISYYKEEKEVILRGGFYQALNFYACEIDGIKFRVLEMVMLNTNRDHLSNPIQLGELDAQARVLFGNMIGVTRNKFIVNYCEKHNLTEDREQYEKALEENQRKLKELMQ